METQDTSNTVNTEVDLVNTKTFPHEEFTRARVESLGNRIRLTDSNEEYGLDLFCYTRCTNDDDPFLQQCRGLVFHGDKLIMKAFSYNREYNHTQEDEIEKHLQPNFSKWRFYDSHEGALLRMFFFRDRWFLSTHRKLNAFRSKWASRESFGTMFKNALLAEKENNPQFAERLTDGENILDQFQNSLDKEKQYMFLLRNSKENRIVCRPPNRPMVFHVGTFKNGKLDLDDDCGLPHTNRLTFLNIDELIDYVQHRVDPSLTQGVLCIGPNNEQVKVLHKDYQDLFVARGNEPSIKFRYLQVRMNRHLTDMLYYLYPEMSEVFDDYENTLYEIAKNIYNSYVQRFIKKRYVVVPGEEFQVIRECHDWHLSDRKNNRISLEKVIKILNKQPPTNLNHMIRRYKMEEENRRLQPRMYPSTPGIAFQSNPPDPPPLQI